MMLKQAHDEVAKNYYDPTFHGVDFEKAYQQFDGRLNTATSVNETFRIIAAFLSSLHDSHTFFNPPARQNHSSMGFFVEAIGDGCFVTRVRPGSDAAAKLHVGDRVLATNGFKVVPGKLLDMQYMFNVLAPARTETLDLLSPTGEQRRETVEAIVVQGKPILDLTSGNDGDYWKLVRGDEEEAHLNRERIFSNNGVAIWKLPSFHVPPGVIASVFNKVMKGKTLIIDVRGSSGGYVDTLKEVLGRLFDHDVKLDDRVSRKEKKPEMAKAHGPAYMGNVIVLIDNDSASAAELLARVIQLEKRGKVLGDKSAGAVMEALHYDEQVGGDYAVFYGFSITSANLLMTDGKSLEGTGVVPDEVMLPTAQDLFDGKDAVLAHAAELAEMKLDPVAAGKLFPFEWPSL